MQRGAKCTKCQHLFCVKLRDHRGTSRQPILLKCSHTFCEACLTKIAKDEKKRITCPTCKGVTELIHGEVSVRKLPLDHYMTGYLLNSQNIMLQQELNRLMPAGKSSSMKKVGQVETSGRLCSECRVNKATCKCLKCDCVMCGLCFDKIHSFSKSLKQHQAVQMTENDDCVAFEDISPVCSLHRKPIEYFCEDDDVAICSRCVIMGDHKNHSIISMEEKNKVVFVDMEPALQFASQVVKQIKKSEKTLGNSVPSVKSETSNATNAIRSHFQYLHAALQSREEELINSVHSQFDDSTAPMVDMKTELLDVKRVLEQTIKAALRAMNNNNDTVLNAKAILDKLNQAKEVECVVTCIEAENSAAGLAFESEDSTLDYIKNLGKITGEVPKRINAVTLLDAHDYILADDTDTASTVSHGSTDIASMGDTGDDDVIIEDEQDVVMDDNDVGVKPDQPALKPIPGRARMQGCSENVLITHIYNPRQFYIQRCSLSARLKKMQKDINIWCNSISTVDDIPAEVNKDDFVLCQYSSDKVWYRSRVLSVMTATETSQNKTVTTRHIEVSYIDFGNHEMVTVDRLREMKPRFMKHHEFLIECALHDIEPADTDGIWSVEAASTVQQMTGNKPMLMTVIREVGNVLEVDLHKPSQDSIVDDRPMSVRDCLVFLELATFVTSSDRKPRTGTHSRQRRDYVKPERRVRGESFNAVISYAGLPSSFCIQPVGEDYQYLTNLMDEMQSVYADGSNVYRVYCPQTDMICVVQSQMDGRWYRARILDLPGCREVDVQYVDFGTVERVSYDRINKILDRHLVLTPLAIQCELIDISPVDPDDNWGEECMEWWTDQTTFQHFHAKIMDVQVDAIQVILYRNVENSRDQLSVNYQLVANGYAKSTGTGSTVLGPEAPAPEKTVNFTYRRTQKNAVEKSSEIAATYTVDHSLPLATTSSAATPGKSSKPLESPTVTTTKNDGNLKIDLEAAKELGKVVTAASGPVEVLSPVVQIEVLVTAYKSPADFHLQVANNDELTSMMSLLQQQFKNTQPSVKQWKRRDFCAAKHPRDQRWYRTKVLEKVIGETVKLSFVDYGFIESLPQDDIRELDIKMRALSCCAIKCHLADIVSTGSSDPLLWSATACEFMAKEIKDKTIHIKKVANLDDEKRGLPVDLLIEEIIEATALEPCSNTVHSLIEKMKDSGLAMPIRRILLKSAEHGTPPPSPLKEKPLIEAPVLNYVPHSVPQTSSVTIIPTYIDYDGVMYCQSLDDEVDLQSLTDKLQETYNDSKPQRVNWVVGQACISYFATDELWFRARVIEVMEDTIKVQYIDYGNSETQSLSKVRIPAGEFVDTHQLCYEFILHGVVPVSEDGRWPVSVLDTVHSMIVNHQCQADIKVIEANQKLEVKLTMPDKSDLGKTLVMLGVATRPDDISAEYSISKKIAAVMKSRFPYKMTVLPSVGDLFPVTITHVELPNVVWFQHIPQEEKNINEDVELQIRQINKELSSLIQLTTELALSNNVGKSFVKVPACGQMCSAKFSFDDCWYRGVVVDRDEVSALVLFVDYGNVELVYLENLRVLAASARSLPAQGVRGHLHDLLPAGGADETWNKQSMAQILELLSGKQLQACIKNTNPLKIQLYKTGDNEDEQKELAYQSLFDEGMALLDHQSLKSSEVVAKEEDNSNDVDVIVEKIFVEDIES